MNRVRIGLLVAGAAIVGIPAMASAQDQPQGERHHDGGGYGRGGDRFGGGQRPDGPAPAAPAGAGQPNPAAGYAERRMQDAGRHYQTAGQPAPGAMAPGQGERGRGFAGGAPAPNPAPGQPGARGGDERRGDAPGGRDFGRFGVNRGPQGYDAPQGYAGQQGYARRDDHRFDGRPGADYRGANDGRRFDNRPGDDGRRFAGGPGRDDRRFDARGWRNDRRYDWRGFRDTNRQMFRAPRYVAPRGYGYGYRPFSVGLRLDPFFYDRSYWIDDPWEYRLPPADGPYRWVRYYNDVLLVDIDTGEVVDVIRDFFW